ncbi:MAG: hydroxymethylglutaryl-CoA reductase, degradative [Anaerolineales bacterium]
MDEKPIPSSRIRGFHLLSVEERRAKLAAFLQDSGRGSGWTDGGLGSEAADHMIENVVGTFGLPLGIALNFIVNGKEILVPMAIEEPSVVAGASFMAKLARTGGGFRASYAGSEMIGQIQVLDLEDVEAARNRLLEHRDDLLAQADAVDPILKQVGGGARDLIVRVMEESPIGAFLVVHVVFDVRDAMGANAVNTACEKLAPRIEAITNGRVHLRILSNLADRRLARAECSIPTDQLAFGEYRGEAVRDGIIEAWAFAAADPYRAATHNKGIMNGVDAVAIATGNDWRAIEAGAHAFAARSGRYTSLSTWQKDGNGSLTGSLEMPMAVGVVGGATRVHPTAQACLKLMGVKTSADLAQIVVAVGLAQNMAALRALATEGIQHGHMALHARQVAIAAGASGDLIDTVAAKMVEARTVRIDRAQEILGHLQGGSSESGAAKES